jgi:hypothetical protein
VSAGEQNGEVVNRRFQEHFFTDGIPPVPVSSSKQNCKDQEFAGFFEGDEKA